MGAWTHVAAKWLQDALASLGLTEHPLPRLGGVQGMKANSVVVQSPTPDAVTAHALFLDYSTVDGSRLEPEVYPRPGGDVYVCGVSEDPDFPPDAPEDVSPSPGAAETLCRVAEVVAPLALGQGDVSSSGTSCTGVGEAAAGRAGAERGGASIQAVQACLLPLSPDGVPLIGPVPGVQGLYVATGHSCWGILNAPATGAALAELIATGDCTLLDLSSFDPARLVSRRKGARASIA